MGGAISPEQEEMLGDDSEYDGEAEQDKAGSMRRSNNLRVSEKRQKYTH